MGDTVSIEFLDVFVGVPPSRTTPGRQKEGPRRPGGPGVAFSSIFEQFWGTPLSHFLRHFRLFFVTCSAYRFFSDFWWSFWCPKDRKVEHSGDARCG